MLDILEETDLRLGREFLCEECQHAQLGGFGKFPGDYPDLVHSYYSLSYLSLTKTEFAVINTEKQGKDEIFQLKPLDCKLSICRDRVRRYFD